MIKRIFCVPLNYSHVQRGQLDAFWGILGATQVEDFDYMKLSRNGLTPDVITTDFVRQAVGWKPDWIWMQLQGSNIIQPWGIDKIKEELPKTVITHWMGDLRTEIAPDLAEICKVTDATLISSVGQIGLYRQAGAKRVEYVQIGLDWDEDVLGWFNGEEWVPPFKVPDVVFIGGYYGDRFPGSVDRLAAIRRLMDEKIDIGVVGEGWPSDIPVIGTCHVKQQHHVWKRAKVALSINHFNDVERYYSDRQLIAMASGTPVVCHHVPGIHCEFRDTLDCCWYISLDQMVVQVRGLLENPAWRRTIGRTGRIKVMREHSWHRRILDLLPTIEEIHESL